LIIEAASDTLHVSDTLLIDNHGEFSWNPDTVIPGIYFLKKKSNDHLLLILQTNKPVHIDAQYINFPTDAIVTGSDYHQDFMKVEEITKNWQLNLQQISEISSDSGWVASPQAIAIIKTKMDSVTNIYRQKILSVSTNPLVKMFALLQSAGSKQLFNPWQHRNLFYQTDSLLTNYDFIYEVREFSRKVKEIKEIEHLSKKFNPGDIFPEMILSINLNDSISTKDIKGNITYIGIYNPKEKENQILYTESLNDIKNYQRKGLQTFILVTDSSDINIKNNKYYYHNYTTGLSHNIKEELGIVKLPANFLLNEQGVIIAKNIWGDKLQNVLRQLHQK